MRNRIVAWILLLLCGGLAADEFSPEKAFRVDDFLTRVARRRSSGIFLKKATFSEEEINSYLNLIYLKKYAPEVVYISLRLKEKNQVGGAMKIKLTDKAYDAVPSFLRDISVQFSGRVECANYRMRYLYDKLIINGASFGPELLDEAFATAQVRVKVKRSLFDWFALLPGLKNAAIGEKAITFFY
jgi:hypothetical protein